MYAWYFDPFPIPNLSNTSSGYIISIEWKMSMQVSGHLWYAPPDNSGRHSSVKYAVAKNIQYEAWHNSEDETSCPWTALIIDMVIMKLILSQS